MSKGSRARAKELRLYIRQQKAGKACMDCKRNFHYSWLSFDHVRGKKLFNLGGSLRGLSMEDIKEELAKTQVVCLTCHADRENQRRIDAAARGERYKGRR